MCWRYTSCTGRSGTASSSCDYMMSDVASEIDKEERLVEYLKKFGVKVNNEWELIERFWNMLAKMHEEGLIEPMKKINEGKY